MRRKKLADILIVAGVVTLVLAGVSFAYQRQGPAVQYAYPDDFPRAPILLSPIPIQPLSGAPMPVLPTPSSTVPATATSTLLPTKGVTVAGSTPEPSATATGAGQTPVPTATPTVLPSATVTPTKAELLATPLPPRIVIPKIGVNASIVEVTWQAVETGDGVIGIWDTTDKGVGHHMNSAQPGEPGNVVLSGHSREKGVFARLAELVPGDEVLVYTAEDRVYRYIVSESVTVPETGVSLEQRRANARYLEPTADARLTLITCWPVWAYTHRLIIIARLAGS